jgi:hypothetical protein
MTEIATLLVVLLVILVLHAIPVVLILLGAGIH